MEGYPWCWLGIPNCATTCVVQQWRKLVIAPTSFRLDGIAGSQREYIHWLLETCTEGNVEAESILTEETVDLLATKLRTPLQIQLHLSLSLEAGYLTGEKPVSAELVESVL